MGQDPARAFEDVPGSDPAVSFLRSTYPPHLFEPLPPRGEDLVGAPFVTLTYAQSLDAKIAGKAGKQLILSGKDSMGLTHRMRELHDSILVGIGTLLNDDAQLNARIPHRLPVALQPTPIILDGLLRTPRDCKLLQNYLAGIGKAPIIVSEKRSAQEAEALGVAANQADLERAGAIVIFADFEDQPHLSLKNLLAVPELRRHLGRSLMIEGGSSIISSFLPAPEVDMIVTTVAPVYVGEGVDLLRHNTQVPQLDHVKTQIFGKDTVFACRRQ
ncbi:hypothetical protein JCM11491_003045 [Sporobolomyces phaffii]